MNQSRQDNSPPRNMLRLGDVIVDRIERLAAISEEPGKLTRLYLGPAHKEAAHLVGQWMRDAGMEVRTDAVGTVVGDYAGTSVDAPVLILGSHIDTVRDAGRYDGSLGVLTAITAVEKLHAAGKRMPFAIQVVAFGDEEGVRYIGTLTGSRALAGRFDVGLLDEVDRDGVTRKQALLAFGCDPSAIAAEVRDPSKVLGYVEVHIEQGPVLETENLPVAVVTAIAGATRGRVVVTGPGGHAGTVPMGLRQDAMTAAAAMILAVEKKAHEEPGLVATVGVIEITDAAVNAIPRKASFSLDVRSASDELRGETLVALQQEFRQIAKDRGVDVEIALTYEAAAAQCDAELTQSLAKSVERNGHPVRTLPSGAGHDAMSFKDRLPFAMLFVRCRGGVSHHPDEYSTPADIDVAARVLADFVENFGV